MTDYELLSILIACFAVLLSAVVWNGQRSLQRRANELQEATAELARKQLEMLAKAEQREGTTQLGLYLSTGSKTQCIEVWNHGSCEAREVRLRPKSPDPNHSVLIPSELEQKLPISRLRPGEVVRFTAAVTLDIAAVHDYVLEWSNVNGALAKEEFTIRL